MFEPSGTLKRLRPKFASVSEEMQQWSALLGTELSTWPKVTARPMFGMTAFYHKGVIFAALPRTKSFTTARSIAFKLHRKDARLRKLLENDPLIVHPLREDGNWIALEVLSQQDLKTALLWLDRAYRLCF